MIHFRLTSRTAGRQSCEPNARSVDIEPLPPRRSTIIGATIGVVLALASQASLTIATNFGGPRETSRACDNTLLSQCVAEGWWHRISYGTSLDARYKTPMSATESIYSTLPGVLVVVDVSIDNTDDARAGDGDYGQNNYYAWTRCSDAPVATGDNGTTRDGYDAKWCKPQLLIFNNWYTDRDYHTANELKALACHEVGHTLGLRHRSQTGGSSSCMRTNPTQDTSVSPPGPLLVPDSHDIQYHLEYEY